MSESSTKETITENQIEQIRTDQCNSIQLLSIKLTSSKIEQASHQKPQGMTNEYGWVTCLRLNGGYFGQYGKESNYRR